MSRQTQYETEEQTTNPYIHPESPRQSTVNEIPYVRTSGRDAGKAIPQSCSMDETFSDSVTKRRGMGGRASILKYSIAYLKAMDRKFAPSSKMNYARRYRRMDREMEMLYKQGLMSTLSPTSMTPEDICNYLTYRANLPNTNRELTHEIAAMNNLFDYIGSNAVRTCLARYPYLRVSSASDRLDPIPDQVVEAVYAEAASVDENDWGRMVSYAVAVIALSTGMRSKEMRLCDINHVHTDSSQWTVDVLHPKGEGNWGKPRNTPIDPRAYPFLKRYFLVRMKRVRDKELATRALFPGGQIDGYFAPNTIREFCKNVSREVGYDFNLRDCRRTYGQHLINLGADIETVSKLLGHATTSTTEGYYCSLRQQKAIERATELFAYQPIRSKGIDLSQLPAGFDMSMDSNLAAGKSGQDMM